MMPYGWPGRRRSQDMQTSGTTADGFVRASAVGMTWFPARHGDGSRSSGRMSSVGGKVIFAARR